MSVFVPPGIKKGFFLTGRYSNIKKQVFLLPFRPTLFHTDHTNCTVHMQNTTNSMNTLIAHQIFKFSFYNKNIGIYLIFNVIDLFCKAANSNEIIFYFILFLFI